MKIALVKCSGSLNVGNEFINAGGIYLVKQIFPDAEFFEYEFFDSAITQNFKYPSPALLDWTKKQIEHECDVMFIFCGCIISKFTANVLEELAKMRVKKVLLGAGAYQYDDFDRKLCLKLSQDYDYIFTRDDETFSYFKGAANVFSGIDLAFFVKDSINNPQEKSDYALINLDLLQDNQEPIKVNYRKLLGKYKNVYVIENTTTPHRETEGFLQIGYWDNLYRTISHAGFVLTNRIHTAVCCLSNSVPFIYTGYDAEGIVGRNLLFHKVGFELEKDKLYDTELENISEQIEYTKKNMLNDLIRLLSVPKESVVVHTYNVEQYISQCLVSTINQTTPKVSVIVPVYNVEQYISQCLDSIINQTLKEIEIICVDDCGTDGSMDIVERYAKRDDRVSVIRHPVNRGLGAARNTGVAAARSKYLACVDSDDYIAPSMLEKAYNTLEETGFDSVWVKVNTWLEDKKVFTTDNYYKNLFEQKGGAIDITEQNINRFPVNAWNKVYRLDFIRQRGIKWSEGLLYEDLEFYYHFYTLSHKTFLIDELLYIYRWRQDSIMNQTNAGKCRCEDIYDVTYNMYNTLKKNKLLEKYSDAFLYMVERNIKLYLYNPHYRNRVITAGQQLLDKINFPGGYKNAREHKFLKQLKNYSFKHKINPVLLFFVKLVPVREMRKKLREQLKGDI